MAKNECVAGSILIKAGRILDPENNIDDILDLYVEKGIIKNIGKNIDCLAEKIIDAGGKWVTPGFIDLHVHFREPGYEHKEEIITGAKAAAAGGFTTVCAMPNTNPVMDNKDILEKTKKICDEAVIDVFLIASATLGQKGEIVSNIEELKNAGACAVSEDGYSVLDSYLVKEAFKACAKNGIPMFSHCEDLSLVHGGVINEGRASEKFNFPGISNDSEDVIVSRDMILAHSTGAKLHLCHMSTEGSVLLIKEAKLRGVNVTAECCPHHFTLCDEDITTDDGNFKMNPPLRSRKDMQAIINALKEGTIDIIATDHAPHHEDEKKGGFLKAANGITGLETAFCLSLTELVKKGILTPLELISKMTWNPAKIISCGKGSLSIGKVADITISDPDCQFEIDVNKSFSKGRNSPFHGRKVFGKIEYTIKSGKIVFE